MNPDASKLPAPVPPSPGDHARPSHLRAPGIFAHSLAWIVLAISLAASTGGWFIARQHDALAGRKRFVEQVTRIQTTLVERM